MPDEYEPRFHPEFFKDLDNLDNRDVKIVDKLVEIIPLF